MSLEGHDVQILKTDASNKQAMQISGGEIKQNK